MKLFAWGHQPKWLNSVQIFLRENALLREFPLCDESICCAYMECVVAPPTPRNGWNGGIYDLHSQPQMTSIKTQSQSIICRARFSWASIYSQINQFALSIVAAHYSYYCATPKEGIPWKVTSEVNARFASLGLFVKVGLERSTRYLNLRQ